MESKEQRVLEMKKSYFYQNTQWYTQYFRIMFHGYKGFKFLIYDCAKCVIPHCDLLLLQEHWLMSKEFDKPSKQL